MNIEYSKPKTIFGDGSSYVSFPDIVRTKDGYLLLYRQSDVHHPNSSDIFLTTSTDAEEWTEPRLFANAALDKQGLVFNCPRLSRVGNKIALVVDTKNSQIEKFAQWRTFIWWSEDEGETWSAPDDMLIDRGLVPDKIIEWNGNLIMGYHIHELYDNPKPRLIQMVATSFDGGKNWRDKSTIAEHVDYDFCEGSIVPFGLSPPGGPGRLLCYLRNNRGSLAASHLSTKYSAAHLIWEREPLDIRGHRIVAAVPEFWDDKIIGTYRDCKARAIGLFVHSNIDAGIEKFNTFELEKETNKDCLFDYGYTTWAETGENEIVLLYYMRGELAKPVIRSTKVKFID